MKSSKMKNLKFPFPKPSINGNIDPTFNFSEPYPLPIPPEVCPDCPFPKSLCEFADECPIDNTFTNFDEENVSECQHATESGCPIYLLKFNKFETFGEVKDVELFEINQQYSKKFTESHLRTMVKNFFLLKSYHEVPIAVLGHGEDQTLLKNSGLPAAGWISNIRAKGRKLFGDFKDVPKKIVPLLKNGAYKKRSIEIYKEFSFKNKKLWPVLRRVAFLGFDIPKIKGLDDILARYSEQFEGESSDNNLTTLFVEDLNMFRQRFNYSGIDESGNFMLNDIIKSDSATGKIIELSENNITVELSSENFFAAGDFENEKGVTATFKEDSIPAPYSKNYKDIEEKIIKKLKVIAPNVKAAVLAAVAGKELTDKQKEIMKLGWPGIYGKKSAAEAGYPYPKPKEMSEEDAKKLEQFQEFQEENAALKSELEQQKTLIVDQTSRIKSIEDDRSEELSLSHLKDIQSFSELLKSKDGVSAALFDDSTFRSFILSLDWKAPLKFSEDKEPATFYDQFKELFQEVVSLAKDNKLLVPLEKIPDATEEEFPDVTGFDPTGVKLDSDIKAYAEKNKVSYEAAYDVVISEQTRKK